MMRASITEPSIDHSFFDADLSLRCIVDMSGYSDSNSQEPEVKYLIADLCEAYQDGLGIWASRVQHLVIGEDVKTAEKLRRSFETGYKELRLAYMNYYKQAGKHFARGDSTVQTKLQSQLHVLVTEIIEVLQHASDDALSGFRPLPGSFARYIVVEYAVILRKSDTVRNVCLTSLEVLFSNISNWAVPLHTLPPLASPPSSSDSQDIEPQVESIFARAKSPFHRQRYTYKKLPTPLSFRLVKVDKAYPWVICEMDIFHLRDPPAFQALSYCWGKYGRRSDIWVNKKLLQISPNLKQGLQRLHKYHNRWATGSWVWIDQICINQEDFSERTQQVRLMRAIYQQALTTVIWLGLDDGSAGLTFQLATDVYQYSLHVKPEEQRDKDRGHIPPESSLALAPPPPPRGIELPSSEDKRWEALPQFLGIAWFERCWIIQEVVVSRGDPVLLCGTQQLLWSRFRRAMTWLGEYNAKYRMDRLKLVKGISDLSSTRDVWELQALLYSTRLFKATDPRDKVFALLGLAGETETPENWPTALAPNYARATRDVYMEVTRYCIQKSKNLSILTQVDSSTKADHASEDLEFPSWVPRWDLPQMTISLSAFTVTQNVVGWRTLIEKFNQASKRLPVSLDVYTSNEIIRLEGIRIGVVQSCLPAMFPDKHASLESMSPQFYSNIHKAIPQLYNICKERLSHLPIEQFARTFFHVTTAGLTPEQRDARHEPMTHFYAFLLSASPRTPEKEPGDPMHSLRTALKNNLSISTLTPTITPPASTEPTHSSFFRHRSSVSLPQSSSRSATSLPAPDSDQPDPTRYTSALAPLINRRLFITSSKHLGLGPANTMSGDTIAVLFGGKVPFVLRNVTGDQWRLIGECYVEGFMQGEGLVFRGETSETGLETEWFDLI